MSNVWRYIHGVVRCIESVLTSVVAYQKDRQVSFLSSRIFVSAKLIASTRSTSLLCRIDGGRDGKKAADSCEDRAMSVIGVFRPEVVCEEGTVASIEGES